MRILLIDDDKLVLKSIAHYLESHGYEVISANSGWEALQYVDKGTVDMIITDVMMPDISGLNLISVFREFYSHRIPVIVMSSMGVTHFSNPALQLRADEYFPKPVDLPALLQCVQHRLG